MTPTRRTVRLLGSALVVLALACTTSGGRPDWVDDAYAGHSRARVLAAVGAAGSRVAATEGARAELARILSAEVESELEVRGESTSLREGEAATRSSVVEQVVESTRIRTEIPLRGSEIADTWRARDGTEYALAVLDKARMRDALAADVRALDVEIGDRLADADRAPNGLVRARRLLGALGPAEERDALLGPLRAVGGPRHDGPSATTLARRAEQALAGLRISVDARGLPPEDGGAPELERALAAQLSDMGFGVVRGASRDDLVLVGRLGAEPFSRGIEGIHTFRWHGSVELRGSQAAAEALAISRDTGDESHPDPRTARELALRKGRLRLVSHLQQGLSRYLHGDTEAHE